MSYTHTLVFYETVTPLHVGCGHDVGVVDLPVIRERTTGYPYAPGSGIRGSVREVFERGAGSAAAEGEPTSMVEALFGPLTSDGESEPASGCVAVHDAKLLLFPVRSDCEVFLWLTCPFALDRFAREAQVFGAEGGVELAKVTATKVGEEEFLGTCAASSVYLEEFVYQPATGEGIEAAKTALASWSDRLAKHLSRPEMAGRIVVVSDRSFGHFVHHATQVQQHVRLTAEKVVADGALFSVEAVPPETIFYGFFGTTQVRSKAWLDKKLELDVDARLKAGLLGAGKTTAVLTLGGDEGTGLGVTRLVWGAAG
jgi:CRISPR-associated protein Cmr4